MISVSLSVLSLWLRRFLSSDSIEGNVKDVEEANNAFLPTYLGYFFVALGISKLETLIVIFVILFAFTLVSQTPYFNPLFLSFGYHFYYMTTKNNVRVFMISKKRIRSVEGLKFSKLKRINDFTYIDLEGEE